MFALDRPGAAVQEIVDLTAAFHEMIAAVGKVIIHRVRLMMPGQMSALEALAMAVEKSTVFVEASQRAVATAASGGDSVSVARAALGPYGLKTRANVARLRL
jgi:hypothetical protein